jgi:hypothetical protein
MSLFVAPGPLLSVSVDLGSQQRGAEVRSHDALEPVVQSLVELLGEARIPATWFAAKPATSAAVHQALNAGCNHEAAIVLAGDWSGHESGRSRFAAEFLRRKRAAEAAGIAVTTLAAQQGVPVENLELLVRHGISAIRIDQAVKLRTADQRISRLRYGLWQIAEVVPVISGGWFGGHFAVRRICRTIDATIAHRSVIHLAIDASRLAAEGRIGSKGLAKILKYIEKRQGEGLLAGSIAEMIDRLTLRRTTRSAQSVLRAA